MSARSRHKREYMEKVWNRYWDVSTDLDVAQHSVWTEIGSVPSPEARAILAASLDEFHLKLLIARTERDRALANVDFILDLEEGAKGE